MSLLERVMATPRRIELASVDLAVPPERAWEIVRHGDLARSRLIRALFALRTLPSRLGGGPKEALTLRIDDLTSSPDKPGFQILVDDAPRELVVGAIGKVWQLDIPFVHVPGPAAFADFVAPGFVKVAWAIQVSPRGEADSHVAFELRVDATDEESWKKFQLYFRLIGPGSHFIRRSLLAALAREHGTPEAKEDERPMPGDDLLMDAAAQLTHGVTISARPEAIWPWLVQMGCHRAGFYSFDVLDNGGERSAREIHPELLKVRVGEVLPATPGGDDGFEILRIEPNRALVLGGLYDRKAEKQLPFATERPADFWQVTWAFFLEPMDDDTTRLHVRARASFPENERFHAAWIRPVHSFMEGAQLRHLKARVEGSEPRDDWHDVAQGSFGAAIMAAAMLTPFLRGIRNHWGMEAAVAERLYPGDDLVPEPHWAWAHAVEIDAPAAEVWPWVAQIGADRGGFYSYQWLENLAGCQVQNAETIHPEWEIREGGTLTLHPKMPPLPVVFVEPGKYFIAFTRHDARARAEGKPWIETSWLFLVEPLGEKRCRFVSRYRCATSDDVATRLQFGQTALEPVGFAMDRRMLLGVKERAERAAEVREREAQALRT